MSVKIHGNTTTGKKFYGLKKVGDSFTIPPDDYAKYNCARAHFVKKHEKATGVKLKIRSRSIKNDRKEVLGYKFEVISTSGPDESSYSGQTSQ